MKDSIGRHNRKLEDQQCEACGKTFRPARSGARFCSRPCAWSKNGGHNRKQEVWWKNQRGYIEGRVTLPDGSRIVVKQHRWIVSGVLGRPLLANEDVHHINGIKDDNRPENLEIIAHGEHSKITNKTREYTKGMKLNLTQNQIQARARRAIEMGLAALGRAAIAKARGEA